MNNLMIDGLEIWIPIIGMIFVLIWGVNLLTSVLRSDVDDTPAKSVLAKTLLEKSANPTSISFSRLSGAIGAFSLAGFLTGLGLWIFFALSESSKADLAKLPEITNYFLVSVALFVPYAFNRISGIFNPGTALNLNQIAEQEAKQKADQEAKK